MYANIDICAISKYQLIYWLSRCIALALTGIMLMFAIYEPFYKDIIWIGLDWLNLQVSNS